MYDRKDRVQLQAAAAHQETALSERGLKLRALQPAGGQRRRGDQQPGAALRDVDRAYGIAGQGEVLHHALGRFYGHFVFRRLAAEDHADVFFHTAPLG